jgi:hypothetical protein
MPFGFPQAVPPRPHPSGSGRTLTASSLSSLLTDFTCVLQGSNPPEVCVEERGCAGEQGIDPKGSRRGAHWAAVDAIRAESCLWVPLRAYGGTACMIVTGSLAG